MNSDCQRKLSGKRGLTAKGRKIILLSKKSRGLRGRRNPKGRSKKRKLAAGGTKEN